jgi:RNA polymerase sigma factor (sigma-70 family)
VKGVVIRPSAASGDSPTLQKIPTTPGHAPEPAAQFRLLISQPHVLAELRVAAGHILRCPTVEADDVVQEAIQRILKAKLEYNPQQASIVTFVLGYIRNIAREKARDLKRTALLTERYEVKTPESPEASLESDDLRAWVREKLEKIPQSYQLPLKLRWIDELEYDDIATRCQINPANARQRVARGLQYLKLLLAGGGTSHES